MMDSEDTRTAYPGETQKEKSVNYGYMPVYVVCKWGVC